MLEGLDMRLKYNLYVQTRLQSGRKYLSYDLWKQEYATDYDLQSELKVDEQSK